MAEGQDGKFIYTGRRNEGGANFRSGTVLFTESSAGYAGISLKQSSILRWLCHMEGTQQTAT